ncbi:MAG: VCBS repeat-containing protein, partial [Anaerolineae bacterium]
MWKKYWYAWLNCTLLLAIILPGVHTQARATNAAFLPGFPKAKIGTMAFGSPTVADLDGDGTLEILTAGYGGCVRAWHADGSPVAGYPLDTTGAGCTGDRINGPLAVADINNDGILEIAAGTRGLSNQPGERGKVYIWQANGTLLPGWPQEMDWNSTYSTGRAEVYSVAFGRMLSGNQFQVVAGTSNNAANNGDFNQDTRNLYAWNPDGTLLPGYPTWYRTAGIWGQVGVADLTGDGLAEAITGRDHMYMHAYDAHGTPLPNWPVHTYVNINQTTWGVHPYIEFTRAAPAIADINRDGQMDIVTTGHIRDPQQGYNVIAAGILVIQADGTRLPGWEVAPTSG